LVCTTAVGRGSKAGSPLRSAPALHRVELNRSGLGRGSTFDRFGLEEPFGVYDRGG